MLLTRAEKNGQNWGEIHMKCGCFSKHFIPLCQDTLSLNFGINFKKGADRECSTLFTFWLDHAITNYFVITILLFLWTFYYLSYCIQLEKHYVFHIWSGTFSYEIFLFFSVLGLQYFTQQDTIKPIKKIQAGFNTVSCSAILVLVPQWLERPTSIRRLRVRVQSRAQTIKGCAHLQ